VLGFPELPAAFQDDAARGATRTAQLQAPDPKPRSSRKFSEPAANTVSSTDRSLDTPAWNRFYRSADRRPIETLTLGSGPAHVAILASMHGDETQSTGLVEELAHYLVQHPEQLTGTTVLLVKSPNPDGYFARSPYNIHGVDLNRNFPTGNWKLLEHDRAGAKPKSEAETQVAVRLLTDFRPSLLVHIKDSRRGGVINFEGNIQSRADQIAGQLSCQVVQGLGEKTSGSVENFALTRFSCPSLTLLLAREKSDQAAWERNRDGLLSLCVATSGRRLRSDATGEDSANSIDDQPDPFEQAPVQKSSLRKPRQGTSSGKPTSSKTGYQSQLPEFPVPVPDVGYLELPSP
jgi:protein MpaA